jgi:hypothetical protein
MVKKIAIEEDTDHLDVEAALHDDEVLEKDELDDEHFDEEDPEKSEDSEW